MSGAHPRRGRTGPRGDEPAAEAAALRQLGGELLDVLLAHPDLQARDDVPGQGDGLPAARRRRQAGRSVGGGCPTPPPHNSLFRLRLNPLRVRPRSTDRRRESLTNECRPRIVGHRGAARAAARHRGPAPEAGLHRLRGGQRRHRSAHCGGAAHRPDAHQRLWRGHGRRGDHPAPPAAGAGHRGRRAGRPVLRGRRGQHPRRRGAGLLRASHRGLGALPRGHRPLPRALAAAPPRPRVAGGGGRPGGAQGQFGGDAGAAAADPLPGPPAGSPADPRGERHREGARGPRGARAEPLARGPVRRRQLRRADQRAV